MDRRIFLKLLGLVGATSLAACDGAPLQMLHAYLEPDESLVPPPVDDEVPEPRGEVVTLLGATVGISGADGEVRVIWAIPNPGFALVPVAGTEIETGSVTMVFSDGSHRSTLAARWDEAEGLLVETTEGRLELSP